MMPLAFVEEVAFAGDFIHILPDLTAGTGRGRGR